MKTQSLYHELYDDFLPLFRDLLGTEKFSITLGGSHGKNMADENSDIDFGTFYEELAGAEVRRSVFGEIEESVIDILQTTGMDHAYEIQYNKMTELIDEVILLSKI